MATTHSADFERFKEYYDLGIWDAAKLRNAVKKGRITAEEFEEITGEKY